MTFKSFVAAGLAAFSLVSIAAAPAFADHRPNNRGHDRGHDRGGIQLQLQFGSGYGPGDCYPVRNGYRCVDGDDGYFLNDFGHLGYDRHPRYPRLRRDHDVVFKLSCDQAIRKLRNNGYYRINAFDCSGKNYGFTAKKNGRRYEVTLNSRTGRYSAERV